MSAKDVLCEDTKRNSVTEELKALEFIFTYGEFYEEKSYNKINIKKVFNKEYYTIKQALQHIQQLQEKVRLQKETLEVVNKANEYHANKLKQALTPKTSEELCEMLNDWWYTKYHPMKKKWQYDRELEMFYCHNSFDDIEEISISNGFDVFPELDLAYEIIKFFKYSKEVVR